MNKTKFTIIDALIVLLVIAVAALGVMKLRPTAGGKSGEVEFTVLVNNADWEMSDIMKPGDEISISYSEKAYAEITNVETEPYIINEFNANLGHYVSHEAKERCNIKVTAKCRANITDTSIENGKVALRVGTELPMRSKGYTTKGYIIEMNEIGGGEE